MRKLILLVFALVPFGGLQAQMPDWTKKTPVSKNYEMDYEVGIGVGDSYKDAEKEAYLDMMKKLIHRCGVDVSTEAVIQSVYSGKSISTINKELKLPAIREVCHTQEILPDKKFRVYLLYQVPRDGSIINPQQYYEEFDGCDKISQFSDGKALAASFFIPGSGQMIKRHYTEGVFTLVGELALVGGGVGTYFIGKKQLGIMQDRTVEYEAFHSAQKMYNTMRIVSYSCYGAAAALYIFNLYRAYTVQARPKRAYAFYPTVIPAEDYNVAMGVGMTIKF